MYDKSGTNQYFLLFGVFIYVDCKKIQRSKNGDYKKQPIYTKIRVDFGGDLYIWNIARQSYTYQLQTSIKSLTVLKIANSLQR